MGPSAGNQEAGGDWREGSEPWPHQEYSEPWLFRVGTITEDLKVIWRTSNKRKKECDMQILRRIPIAIAFISAMLTVASYRALATDVTILEATSDKLVISIIIFPSGQHEGRLPFEEAERLGAEHCKEFGLFTGETIMSVKTPVKFGVITVPCDTKEFKRKTYEETRSDYTREATHKAG